MSEDLDVDDRLAIPAAELTCTAIRAQGAGGQNVNKVATAIQLRFDAAQSTALPDAVRERLLALPDRRIGSDGVVVIKAQRYRTQEANRKDALGRLRTLLAKALEKPRPRKPTRPPKRAREERLRDKAHRAKLKSTRGPVSE